MLMTFLIVTNVDFPMGLNIGSSKVHRSNSELDFQRYQDMNMQTEKDDKKKRGRSPFRYTIRLLRV